MAQDTTYTTKTYHRRADVDGKTVSGYTIGTSGAIIIESGGALRCTDSAEMVCESDFNFGIRTEFTTAEIIKNYLIGRNTWSVCILSGVTLAVGNLPTDSQPPVLTSRIGYFFISMAKAANNHTMSCRLACGYQGEEVVIQFRGLGESAVLDIHFSDSNILPSPIVYGMSDEGQLQEIQLLGSDVSAAFLRLVAVSDTEWAVVNAGGEMGDGGGYIADPA